MNIFLYLLILVSVMVAVAEVYDPETGIRTACFAGDCDDMPQLQIYRHDSGVYIDVLYATHYGPFTEIDFYGLADLDYIVEKAVSYDADTDLYWERSRIRKLDVHATFAVAVVDARGCTAYAKSYGWRMEDEVVPLRDNI
jgi:hypothetical protein